MLVTGAIGPSDDTREDRGSGVSEILLKDLGDEDRTDCDECQEVDNSSLFADNTGIIEGVICTDRVDSSASLSGSTNDKAADGIIVCDSMLRSMLVPPSPEAVNGVDTRLFSESSEEVGSD